MTLEGKVKTAKCLINKTMTLDNVIAVLNKLILLTKQNLTLYDKIFEKFVVTMKSNIILLKKL